MGQSMVGRLAIRARQVSPGEAFAAAVPAGGLVEIVDLDGHQVAEFVAFDQADPSEHLSLGVTRRRNQSIMLTVGMKLYSSRGREMLELIEDTVGRHDILWASPTGELVPSTTGRADDVPAAVDDAVTDEAVSTESDPAVAIDGAVSAGEPVAHHADGLATPQQSGNGFPRALAAVGVTGVDAPDPVNFFMQLAVMQKGDLELRTSTSERGDRVVLRAVTDLVIAVRSSAATDETNGEEPTDVLVRVYR